eukprot:gb/GECH01012958.1/.p1 GENE.gb/GECH01012958.1/~~gb/GECH01012958.1/.p1  ORF type:complete len:350 (+),score=98.39 gb/GECH01012958.1/:1-1050(+)
MSFYTIAIHGGAGKLFTNLKPEKRQQYQQGLQNALNAGYCILKAGGTAVDAVEAAVMALEDCQLLNAGRGSVFNCRGEHEMEAAIMNGQDLECGAISCVTRFKNPISIAKMVMNHSPHVFLVGEGVELFAQEMEQREQIIFERRDSKWFHVETRYKQWQEALKSESIALDHDIDIDEENDNNNNDNINNNNNTKENNSNILDETENINISRNNTKIGTVGAVALDQHGNVAAATSTGGLTNKKVGRVGDSPLIGCGTYANNHSCAVSCTGHGEVFIRHVTAHSVSAMMEFGGMTLKQAVDTVLKKRLPSDVGGLVAVAPNGDVEMAFNSEGMFCGVSGSQGRNEIHMNA